MNNITEKTPRAGASSRWRFIVNEGVLTLQRNTDDAIPFRTYEIVGTFGTDGTVEFAGDVSVAGSANSLDLAGSAATLPVTLTATGTDADIPIQIQPKGDAGFLQVGRDTYGASGDGGWLGYASVGLELVDFTPPERLALGIYAEVNAGDISGSDGGAIALETHCATQGDGALHDLAYSYGGYFNARSNLAAGRTIANVVGVAASVGNAAAGTVVSAYLFNGDVPQASALNPITNFYGMYLENASAVAGITNRSAFWYNSPGVYRIDGSGVAGYHNPSFTKYTPGLANLERIVTQWNTSVAEIGAEQGGNGTLRPLKLLGSEVRLQAPFVHQGSTSGSLTHAAPATITSYTVQWPSAPGTANQIMRVASVAGTVLTMEWHTP